MKKPTLVNSPPTVELPPGNRPLVAPIYQTVKFEFDTLEDTERYLRGERPGFFYTRASNPTTRQLEQLLAQLQGREECLVTASGVAAISQTLLTLTKQGDHIICFVETYNPSRYLIRRLLGRFGLTHTMLSIEDLAGVERAFAAQPTRLVFFESPTKPGHQDRRHRRAHAPRPLGGPRSPSWTTPLPGFTSTAITMWTCSFTALPSTPPARRCHGRGRHRARRADPRHAHRFRRPGGTLDPHAAFLILRGLKTLFRALPDTKRQRGAHRAAPRCPSGGRAGALPGACPRIRSTRWRRSRCATSAPSSASSCGAAGRRCGASSTRWKLFALAASLGSTDFAGGDAADHGCPGAERGAAEDIRHYRGYRAAVDRARGTRMTCSRTSAAP